MIKSIVSTTTLLHLLVYFFPMAIICHISLSQGTSVPLPEFEVQPIDFVDRRAAIIGLPLYLKCRAKSHDVVTYRWRHNGTEVALGSRIRLNEGNLTILATTRRDHGQYQCFATNQWGTSISRLATVDVGNRVPIPHNLPDTVKRLGSGAMLNCNLPSTRIIPPIVKISWERQSDNPDQNQIQQHPVTSTDRIYISNSDGNLYFTSTESQDAGIYRCIITQVFYLVSNDSFINIHIYGQQQRLNFTHQPPMVRVPTAIARPLRDITVLAGSQVKLECITYGKPTPSIMWLYNDQMLSTHPKIKTQNHQRELIIENMQPSLRGTYSCYAFASDSSKFSECEINVIQQPTWKIPLQRADVCFTNNVTMPCMAEGDNLVYLWYHNGKRIYNGSKYTILPRGNITVNNAIIEDAKVYTCIAMNSMGNIVSNAYLNVHGCPPTLIKVPHEEVIALIGDSVSIDCMAEGIPEARAQLIKNNRYVNLDIHDHITYARGFGFTIHSLKPTDEGVYKCGASNVYGKTESQGIMINVCRETTATVLPRRTQAPIGSTITLTCLINKDRRLATTVHWYKNDDKEPLSDDRQISISVYNETSSQLIIRNVGINDSNTYNCVVISFVPTGNTRKFAKADGDVIIQAPPFPPVDLRYNLNRSNKTVVITWHHGRDNNSPILYYKLFIAMNSDRYHLLKDHIPVWQPSATVVSVYPYNIYRFAIVAVNKLGSSSYAYLYINDTYFEVPGYPPLRVRARYDHERKGIEVWWKPIPRLFHFAPGFGYRIIVNEMTTSGIAIRRDINLTDANVNHTIITGFQEGKRYIIRAQTYNNVGITIDPYQNLTVRFGTQPPHGIVKNVSIYVISYSSVVLTWSFFSESDHSTIPGNNIIGYRVELMGNDAIFNSTTTTLYHRNTILLDKLDESKSYTYRINAFNEGGDSKTYLHSSLELIDPVPGPVKHLIAREIDIGTIRLDWQPPVVVDGSVTSYTISYGLAIQRTDEWQVNIQDGNLTSMLLSGPFIDGKYRFTVAASNKNGGGLPISVIAMARSIIPSSPFNLRLLNISQTTALISWQVQESDVIGFIMEYKESAATQFSVYDDNIPDDSRETELVGLVSNTVYEIRLKTKGSKAHSQASKSISIQTLAEEPMEVSTQFYNQAWFIVVVTSVCSLIVIIIAVAVINYKQHHNSDNASNNIRDKAQDSAGYTITIKRNESSAKAKLTNVAMKNVNRMENSVFYTCSGNTAIVYCSDSLEKEKNNRNNRNSCIDNDVDSKYHNVNIA